MRQYELVDRVSRYQPNADEDILNRAYVFATKMHGDQKRASGDPYFSHPVEVAGILTSLRLDSSTIITALLHDTLEDTEATYDQLSSLFGVEIADLVDGVTQLSKLDFDSRDSAQAANFRKFLTATASDVRVLLVKLADRLHNMRTLSFISDASRRRRIAQETMDIYAPLAGRIGMQAFRDELDDLAFAELHPEAHRSILVRLDAQTDGRADMLDAIAYELKTLMATNGLSVRVSGRRKMPFSIWRKMAHHSIAMEQLSDVYGYRIIVDDEVQCYQALGFLHCTYRHVPGRYKDYISTPKQNNYRSLHTTVIGPNQQRVEVQIRTSEMHEVAECGIAAHWHYKENGSINMDMKDRQPFVWLQEMVEHLQRSTTAKEFLEHTKLELYLDQVFCFTPKGRLIVLPHNACVIDFAYAVHTEIGHSCSRALVNGVVAPLHTKLNTGDTIEIIRDSSVVVQDFWLHDAVTGKARVAIRHALREHDEAREAVEDADYAALGRDLLYSLFVSEGREASPMVLERSLGIMEYESLDALYAAIGRGRLAASDVLRAVYPSERRSRTGRMLAGAMRVVRPRRPPAYKIMSSLGRALRADAVKIAPGYFLLPGDLIIGLRVPDCGILIYPRKIAQSLFADQRENWVDIEFKASGEDLPQFMSRLNFTLVNKTGVLNTVTRTIADFDANIANLRLTRRDEDFCNLTLDIEVRDVDHVNHLLAALRGISVVSSVKRVIAEDTPRGGSEVRKKSKQKKKK